MNSTKINELISLAQNGDISAEKEIFEYLLVRFRLFAGHYIKEKDAIEDIVQEACIVINKKYKNEQFNVSFESWAHGIFKMMIRKHYDKITIAKNRKIALKQRPFTSEQSDIEPDLERQLRNCMKQIFDFNKQYARVLNLVYQGFQSDEICGKLKIQKNNLYVITNRSRNMLKICLEKGNI